MKQDTLLTEFKKQNFTNVIELDNYIRGVLSIKAKTKFSKSYFDYTQTDLYMTIKGYEDKGTIFWVIKELEEGFNVKNAKVVFFKEEVAEPHSKFPIISPILKKGSVVEWVF